MSIARGSRSRLDYYPESTYGVAPGGNWRNLLFQNETLGENINTVTSQDIRPDRANPALRGGNIAGGGAVTMDFTPRRQLMLLKHLLAATPVATQITGAGVTAADVDASTAYAVGDLVTGSTSSIWLCVTAGTTPVGTDTGDLVAGLGVDVTLGTAVFRPMVQAFGSAVFRRGMVVVANTSQLWLCSRGGEVAQAQTLPVSPAAGQQVEVSPANGTVLPPRFQYIGTTSKLLYVHLLRGGDAWPTGGLAVQKSIIGGTSPLYLLYRGGRVNSMELTVPQENIVTATFNLLFQGITPLQANGAGTPTLQADAPFAGLQSMISLNDPLGTGVALVREFSMTLSNQADENTFIIGSRDRADIPEQTRLANGRMSVYFADTAGTYAYFKNETVVPVTLDFAYQGYYLGLDFPETKLTGNGTPQISGGGLLMANFDWTAFRQDAGYDVQVTAVNDLATL